MTFEAIHEIRGLLSFIFSKTESKYNTFLSLWKYYILRKSSSSCNSFSYVLTVLTVLAWVRLLMNTANVLVFKFWNSLNCHHVGVKIGLTCKTKKENLSTFADINECESFPCQNIGTCNDEINRYNCTCVVGYTGTLCETGYFHTKSS